MATNEPETVTIPREVFEAMRTALRRAAFIMDSSSYGDAPMAQAIRNVLDATRDL